MPPAIPQIKKKKGPSARDLLVQSGGSLGSIGESGRLTSPLLPTSVDQQSGQLTPFSSAQAPQRERLIRPGEQSVAVAAPIKPQGLLARPEDSAGGDTLPARPEAESRKIEFTGPATPSTTPAAFDITKGFAPPTVAPPTPDATGAGEPPPTTTDGQAINTITGGVVEKTEAEIEADRLAAEFSGGIAPSAEERQTQQALDIQSANLGLDLAGNRERAVALPFITGAAAALERSAGVRASVLEQRLTRLQAKRIAGQAVSKFALDRADKKVKAEQDAEAGEGDFTLGQGQQRFDAEGNVIAGVDPKETVPSASTDPDRVLSVAESKTLGVPFGTTARQALGITAEKPLTESQARSLSFGTRMSEAAPTIDELEEFASGHNSITFAASIRAEGSTIGSATVISDEFRQMRQAERNFLNAVLRRESGAVISPSEFVNGAKQYFPRPGDDATTLAQKKQNRDTATRTMLEGIVDQTPSQQTTGEQFELDGVIFEDDGTGNFVPKAEGGTETSEVAVNIPEQSRLSSVNNNPGNLRFAQQRGASQGEGGFARFETPEAGFQALKNQISLDASRGLTLEQFINKFAPPSENDTQLYVSQMVQATGADGDTLVSEIDLDTLAKAMARKESSTIIS